MVNVREEGKIVHVQPMVKLSQQTASYGWTTSFKSSFSLTWHVNTTLENKEQHRHTCDRPDGEVFQQMH